MGDYFNMSCRSEIRCHLHSEFQKHIIAGLCAKLAEGAQKGDEMCKAMFRSAGKALANHIRALLPNVHPDLLNHRDGIPIVCVGSVFKSWPLLKKGFFKALKSNESKGERKRIKLSLLRVKTCLATGAVYLGAKEADYYLPRDYSQNVQEFYSASVSVCI